MITEFLRADHRACDEHVANAENAASRGRWDEARAAVARAIEALERHLRMEEEVLFPEFERATGAAGGPTQVMRDEHEQMRALFPRLREAVQAGDSTALLAATEGLLVLIQQHNMKEEQILYPMAEETLTDPAAVVARMKDVGGI